VKRRECDDDDDEGMKKRMMTLGNLKSIAMARQKKKTIEPTLR
jgi:hypothetical protein